MSERRIEYMCPLDTEVYTERNRLPGVSISISKLMQHLLGSIEKGNVSITVEHRSDVDTGMWWTVAWGEKDTPRGRFAAATTPELALFRAAVFARQDDERARKYAGMEPKIAKGAT